MRGHSDNSQKDGDGHIFQQILYYQEQGDEEEANRWLAKWSFNPSKVRDFHQLQNSIVARSLKRRLNENRHYPGLWEDFEMGTFHRILSMRCHEVGNIIR
jgi:hypothetical protein